MPRSKATPQTTEAPAAVSLPPLAHIIKPTAVYRVEGLRRALGLAQHTIPREIRKGRLPAYARGGKTYLIGADVLAWLRGGKLERPWRPKVEAGAQEDTQ